MQLSPELSGKRHLRNFVPLFYAIDLWSPTFQIRINFVYPERLFGTLTLISWMQICTLITPSLGFWKEGLKKIFRKLSGTLERIVSSKLFQTQNSYFPEPSLWEKNFSVSLRPNLNAPNIFNKRRLTQGIE